MRRYLLVLAPVILFGPGCQSGSPFVTRVELRDLLAFPPAAAKQGLGAEDRRERVELLVDETFAAPDARTRAAAALATAGHRAAPLAAALKAIDQAFEVCATNLANLETTAYKASYAVRDPGGAATFRVDHAQGSLQNTGRQLDVGIAGQGFFKVRVADSIGDGYAYTRNGNFFINKDGDLMLGMGDGYFLEPRITTPVGVTEITISSDGAVEVVRGGSNVKTRVGQLQLFQFMNPQGLNVLGGGLFTQTESAGHPIASRPGENGSGQVVQGFLESSNVDPERERLRMRFLSNSRASLVKVIDEMR